MVGRERGHACGLAAILRDGLHNLGSGAGVGGLAGGTGGETVSRRSHCIHSEDNDYERACSLCGKTPTRLITFCIQFETAEIKSNHKFPCYDVPPLPFDCVRDLRVISHICRGCAVYLTNKLDREIETSSRAW